MMKIKKYTYNHIKYLRLFCPRLFFLFLSSCSHTIGSQVNRDPSCIVSPASPKIIRRVLQLFSPDRSKDPRPFLIKWGTSDIEKTFVVWSQGCFMFTLRVGSLEADPFNTIRKNLVCSDAPSQVNPTTRTADRLYKWFKTSITWLYIWVQVRLLMWWWQTGKLIRIPSSGEITESTFTLFANRCTHKTKLKVFDESNR